MTRISKQHALVILLVMNLRKYFAVEGISFVPVAIPHFSQIFNENRRKIICTISCLHRIVHDVIFKVFPWKVIGEI